MLDITCESSADPHVMPSIIPSENYVEHALKMSSASRDWRFKDSANVYIHNKKKIKFQQLMSMTRYAPTLSMVKFAEFIILSSLF